MSGTEGPANGGTSRYSSSPELSSPPCSPSDPGSPAARQLLNDQREAQDSIVVNPFGVVSEDVDRAPPPVAPPARKKPGRKPKIALDGASATSTDTKPKRVRKPRDPSAPPPAQRKKKNADLPDNNNTKTARQSKLTELNMRPVNEPVYSVLNEPFQPPYQMSQNGKYEDIQKSSSTPASFFNTAPPPQPRAQPPQQQAQLPQQTQPVRTSGQNYDPIRSNYDPVRENGPNHSPYHSQMSPKPAPLTNHASASPSIASLVDPPHQASTSPSMATQSFFQHQMKMQNTSVPPSPTSNRIVPSPTMNPSNGPSPSAIQSAIRVRQEEPPAAAKPYVRATAPPPSFIANPAQITSIVKSGASSSGPTPKPSKPVDATPPPLPGQGNGLFSNHDPKDGTESRAPTIMLHIPLNGGTNKYVNFTRLAEERYGWDALHPRLAAQRERLARVAAAGAALEKSGHKESGDEMSLDMSDAEGDNSNIEMGGMSDARTGTDGGVKKVVKKRRMKEDDYDKDDGFVDDSDLLWEEQAAASVDGFFVYSGPLVHEGEKPVLERADGAGKRTRGTRGGRGGARVASGSRGGATTAGSAGGPGSRGGSTTRKPRITKADRARRDAEKLEREKMGAMAARPSTYVLDGGAPHHLGGTPMVFEHTTSA